MGKEEQLNELKSNLLTADPVPALSSQATQLVFGDGSPDADVMFIGEAPGKKEDEQGMAFVGAAGKFLDEMLSSISLSRKDIYITNIVKYRPPNNRDPEPDEKTAFWPYLLKQIAIIRPKVIVTLGRHSGQAFLPKLRISNDHGQPNKLKVLLDGKEENIIVLPLYHPAAALYNGGLRGTLLDDFQSVKQFI